MTVRIDTGLGDVVDVSATVAGSVSDTWQAAFGSYTAPGAWQSATKADAGNGQVTVTLTVGQGHYNPVAGTYWLWVFDGTDAVNTQQRYIVTDLAGIAVGIGTKFAVIAFDTDNVPYLVTP